MYVPEKYGNIFPYLLVENADELVRFLERVFDATEIGRTVFENRVANVRVAIGASAFMLAEADGEQLKPMPASYYVYVENVDETFEKALANGATMIFAPADMPYKDRQAGIRDPAGNLWWISKRLVDAPYD